jgi:hypothetical protein
MTDDGGDLDVGTDDAALRPSAMRTLILLALLLPLAGAEQGITGSVTMVTGGAAIHRRPAKGQHVVIYRGSIPVRASSTADLTDAVAAEVVTGDDGRFRAPLPSGNYTVALMVDAGGQIMVRGAVGIERGQHDAAGKLLDAAPTVGDRPTMAVAAGAWTTCDIDETNLAAP